MINRKEVFEKEIGLLDEAYKPFALKALEIVPEYYFTMPASTSGKYHPDYALGEGGLSRHVKAAVKLAYELFRMEEYTFDKRTQNLIIVALLLHDAYKMGLVESASFNNYTQTEHPVVAVQQIKDSKELSELLPAEDIEFICSLILTHMGQWNTNRSGSPVMPKPSTKEEKFVHLCDYIASRNFVEINFAKE